tara:strand:- start:225 stop:824 length:600 start_codon:yes stop_codon:yes gene_type:complete
MGNVLSVSNALRKLNVDHIISNKKKDIKNATALIFPGVGAFPMAMQNLKSLDIGSLIKNKIIDEKTPFLGICLGMQILFEDSEEQKKTKGLGILKGSIIKFKDDSKFIVPHVGWNVCDFTKNDILFNNIKHDAKFYYDHSFFAPASKKSNVIGSLHYQLKITSAVRKNNIFGVQFHPEKSQRNGLRLLRNFTNFSLGLL